MKKKSPVAPFTRDQLQKIFSYYPDAGVLVWSISRKRAYPGKLAGSKGNNGWKINIDGRGYSRAAIVWLFETGKWPTDLLIKKNGDKYDDRFCNLRMLEHTSVRTVCSEIEKHFTYDASTGRLFWKQQPAIQVASEREAGHFDGNRCRIGVAKKLYYRSDLVWFIHTGNLPKHGLKHINGDLSDDRFSNLRETE